MVFGTLVFLLSAFTPNQQQNVNDLSFHKWCNKVGVETPLAHVRTTEESVAGRGVFASESVEKGSVVMRIPQEIVFTDWTASQYFPDTAASLAKRRKKLSEIYQRRNKWWNRLFRGRMVNTDFEFADPSDWWQAELPLYCEECLKLEDHPWKLWMMQWNRNDPMQRLYDKRVSFDNNDAVDEYVTELKGLLPDASSLKLRAAVDIRLRRLDALKRLFRMKDKDGTFDAMYGLLISRAIGFGDQNAGVIPCFDMVNHSPTPNLGLAFDGSFFEMIALRPIAKDEEVRRKLGICFRVAYVCDPRSTCTLLRFNSVCTLKLYLFDLRI
jgi:hypothetical protein